MHLFQKCPYTLQLYEKLQRFSPAIPWPTTPTMQITDEDHTGSMKREHRTTMMIMQFVVWRERCARSFTEKSKETGELLEEIVWQLKLTKRSEQQQNRE